MAFSRTPKKSYSNNQHLIESGLMLQKCLFYVIIEKTVDVNDTVLFGKLQIVIAKAIGSSQMAVSGHIYGK